MAGLLYKDFVGIKGKRIVWILIACTVLFLILRFVFPGDVTTHMAGSMRESETGELVEMTVGEFRDSFLMTLPLLLIACGFMLLSTWTAAICKNDERNKTRQFIGALPLGENAYIASKYIFIGIVVYTLFSLENIWIIIFQSMAGNNRGSETMSIFSGLLTVFCGMSLLLASIELPFFITFGVKKGTVIKTAVLEGAAFLVMAYLLFGNLKIFENFDIYVFANWCREHTTLVALISVMSPIADVFIFWISYRITCRINRNREVEFDG